MPPATAKTTTYGELTKQLEQLRQTYAVYEYIHDHLDSEFLAKDGRPPRKVMATEGSMSSIPEQVIEDVLETIGTNALQELRSQIAAIEEQSLVYEDEDSDEDVSDEENNEDEEEEVVESVQGKGYVPISQAPTHSRKRGRDYPKDLGGDTESPGGNATDLGSGTPEPSEPS